VVVLMGAGQDPIYQQRRQAVECIEPINKKNI
jgi:hypothetical protein